MTNSRHITESGHWAHTSSYIQRRMKCRLSELDPTTDGTLFFGLAVSKRGRRYEFRTTAEGDVGGVYREDPTCATADGSTFWESVRAPRALRQAVRKAVAS